MPGPGQPLPVEMEVGGERACYADLVCPDCGRIGHHGPSCPLGASGRIMLAGDWHGNAEWGAQTLGRAAELGCSAVLQLGDFGLWPGREDALLDRLAAAVAGTGVELVWIDGNHENHAWLDAARAGADDRGLVELRPGVSWASRGSRWQWGGRRFGALGGAVSIDRFLRKAGTNWWPQESPDEGDVARLGDEPLDVLATHAAPAAVPIPLGPSRLPDAILADVRRARSYLDEAVARTRPRLVVHGHHHVRYRAVVGDVRVEGLARDGAAEGASAVLDLASLEVW